MVSACYSNRTAVAVMSMQGGGTIWLGEYGFPVVESTNSSVALLLHAFGSPGSNSIV